jgi:hypothetical protein
VTVAGNIYVQRVQLEGVPLATPFVTFSALGGEQGAGGAGSAGGASGAGFPSQNSSGGSSSSKEGVAKAGAGDCVLLEFWMGSDPTGPWQ